MLKVRARLAKENPKYDLLTEIDAMSEVPVAFEPGTRFLYGFGHELVAGLIQVVSGKKVSEFLKEELFEPLGMNSTGYRFFGDIRDRMAVMYHRDEDGTLTDVSEKYDDRLQEDAVYEGGGAGLFSTVPDYLAFTQMLAAGGTYRGHHYIGRKTIDLMRQNQLNETQLKDFRNSYLAGYGYGLGVRTMMDPGAAIRPPALASSAGRAWRARIPPSTPARASPWCTCTSLIPTWKRSTITAFVPWPMVCCDNAKEKGGAAGGVSCSYS